MNEPQYELESTIQIKDGYHKGKIGTIEGIEKLFRELNKDGTFNPDGLDTIESNIPSIQLPYKFDGNMLTVEVPEMTIGNWIQKAYVRKSLFRGYAYSVRLNEEDGSLFNHLILISESNIKPLSVN